MYTYIQVTDKDSGTFKGYVYFDFNKKNLSMTLIRGMRALHHIVIPLDEIIDLTIDNVFSKDHISFFHDGKKYELFTLGLGEENYLERHILKVAKV